MNRFKVTIIAVLVFALHATASTTNVGAENSINSYISHVDSCFVQKNITCMSDAMANDFVLVVESTFDEKKSVETLNKEKYLESTKYSWSAYQNYSYKQLSKKVISSSSESPSYSEVVIEKFTANKINYEVTSESVIFLEIVGSKVFAKKIEAKAKIKII